MAQPRIGLLAVDLGGLDQAVDLCAGGGAVDGIAEQSGFASDVALSTECGIPSLVQARKSVEQMLIESEGIKESKRYRLFYFVIIAFALGGKVANSSTKLTGHDALDLQKKKKGGEALP